MIEPWGYQEVQGYVGNESREPNSEKIEELKKTKVDGAEYKKDENKITLTAEGKEVASIDTTDFVKDGMIESVELDGTVLKMVFNTDAGKEEIDIDFKDIVSGVTSYTKDEIDSMLDEKADKTDIPSLDEYAKTADVQAEIDNAVSGKVDASDVYTKDEVDEKLDEKADKSDIPSMDEYAKADDVQAEIDNAVSGKADSSDVEAVEAQITQILSDITALNGKDDELQAAIDLKAGQNDLVAETERASAKESEIEENVAKKVDWVESTPGRNHIVLKNHDSLLGTATDGATYNVAMVSKWDVADFGSAQLHANLNSKDGIVTINDNKAIATKDEVEAVDAKVEAIDLTSYAKSEDVNAELANKANASDLDALSATVGELSGKVDEKALQSDLDAFEASSTEVLDNEIARAEAKEAELAAKDEAQDAEIVKKVDWVESTPGRNHIVLKNHDSVLGTATDGSTYNLAMVSKWDVADFGSAQLHANLNSKDGSVTINDDKVVATKDEVEAVDAKVNAIDLTPFAKIEDMNAAVEALNAKDAELEAAIPTAAAQAVAQVVADAPEDLDTLKEVADYIAADKTKATEIENKLAELTAKDEAQDAEIALKADKTELELLAKSADVTAEIAAAVSVLNAKDEAQDAEIALKADSDKVYTKEDVNNTLEGYVPVEQYNDLKARLDNLEIMLSVYNAEREAQMDEIISNMSSDNKEVVIDTLMESIVVPETTVAYTITAPLTDNSTVELTSPKYMTLINTSKEPVSTTISHEYTEGETTAATSVYLVGDFDTLTIENVSPSVKSGYDAASVKNVVIPETNVKNLSLALDFQDGATITNNSDKDITIIDKNDSAIALTVVAPNSTVTLNSGQFTTLNAEVSDNTLIIKKNVHIANLNLEKGNAIVEVARQEEVAGIVENYTVADGYSVSHRIYHITNDNSSKLGGVGEMILDEDIVRTASIVAPLAPAYDAVWNLNGHNLTVEGTPKSGVYLNRYASNLEVKGDGVIHCEGSYGLWNNGTTGKIIINDGVTIEAQTHAVYAEKGVIEINGGTFKLTNWADADKDENGNLRFLLNCLDANYKNGTANIVVKGGKFYDFDPANCAAEGVGTSFVADGYESVASTETIDGVEHTVYTVKKA